MSFESQLNFYCPILNPALRCTKEQVLEQVRDCMDGIGQGLGNIAGLDIDQSSTNGKQYRLKSARLCRIAEVLYDYAVEGVWPDTDRVGEGEHLDDIVGDMAFLSGTARVAAELYGSEVPTFLEKLLGMALVRTGIYTKVEEIQLDSATLLRETEYLALQHIALLAQMTEKAVRNATQPTAKDRLETIKVGAKTMVTHEEALRWLSNRRNFKPTVVPDSLRTQTH